MDTPLHTIAVVGLGTMGTGIAEVLARAGREVIGIDISDAAARQAVLSLEASTARAVERERITEEERRNTLARFRTFSDLQAAADADLVIEVVSESYEAKHQVFRALDGIVRPTAIVATGTNALSVTRLAADSAHPERVLGLHFFNPAPAMKLVEVVSSVLTAPTAVEAVTSLARELGKEPVAVGDRPGFVADGLLFGYLNQAAAMYEAKYASREDIDAAMKLGCGLPMGPLALLDLIGVDTARTVLEAMYSASRDRLHAPAPILKQLSRGGPDRPEGGPRLLHLRRARRSGSGAGRTDAATRGRRGRRPWGPLGRRGRFRHDGQRYRGGLRQGRVPGGARRAFPGEGGDGHGPYRQVPCALRRQGPDDGRGQGRDAGPDHRGRFARRLRGRRSRRRGGRRGPGDQAAAVRHPRQGLQGGCGARHHHLLAARRGLRPRHLASAGRDRHALLQPGSGDEAGRGGPYGPDRRRRPRHGSRG